MHIRTTKMSFRLFNSLALALTLCVACNGSNETDEEPDTGAAIEAAETDTAPEDEQQAVEPVQPPPVENRQADSSEVYDLRIRLGLAELPPVIVADLITRLDVRELVQFEGALRETSLTGIEADVNYNSIRLSADGGYGFALQLWMLDESRQVAPRYQRLRETYFQSSDMAEPLGDDSFSADFEGIRHVAFMDRASRTVGVVTCQASLCDATQLRALAQRALDRL